MNAYLLAEHHGDILTEMLTALGLIALFFVGAIIAFLGGILFTVELVIQLKQKRQASRTFVVGLIMLMVGIGCLVIGSSNW